MVELRLGIPEQEGHESPGVHAVDDSEQLSSRGLFSSPQHQSEEESHAVPEK